MREFWAMIDGREAKHLPAKVNTLKKANGAKKGNGAAKPVLVPTAARRLQLPA